MLPEEAETLSISKGTSEIMKDRWTPNAHHERHGYLINELAYLRKDGHLGHSRFFGVFPTGVT